MILSSRFLSQGDSVFARHSFKISWDVNRQGFHTLHSREVKVITLVLLNEFIRGITIPLSCVSPKIYKENPISGTSL